MSSHLRRLWSSLRRRGEVDDILNITGFKKGERIVVNHPEIGQPVGGVITGIVPRSMNVLVRFDGITDLAMVPVELLERE